MINFDLLFLQLHYAKRIFRGQPCYGQGQKRPRWPTRNQNTTVLLLQLIAAAIRRSRLHTRRNYLRYYVRIYDQLVICWHFNSNIVPWLKKNKNIDPISGKSLSARDLIRLHFHKNAEGMTATLLYSPISLIASRQVPLPHHIQRIHRTLAHRGHSTHGQCVLLRRDQRAQLKVQKLQRPH